MFHRYFNVRRWTTLVKKTSNLNRISLGSVQYYEKSARYEHIFLPHTYLCKTGKEQQSRYSTGASQRGYLLLPQCEALMHYFPTAQMPYNAKQRTLRHTISNAPHSSCSSWLQIPRLAHTWSSACRMPSVTPSSTNFRRVKEAWPLSDQIYEKDLQKSKINWLRNLPIMKHIHKRMRNPHGHCN